MAYLAVQLVSGLCLYSAWRKQGIKNKTLCKLMCDLSFEWSMAWSSIYLCSLGRITRYDAVHREFVVWKKKEGNRKTTHSRSKAGNCKLVVSRFSCILSRINGMVLFQSRICDPGCLDFSSFHRRNNASLCIYNIRSGSF